MFETHAFTNLIRKLLVKCALHKTVWSCNFRSSTSCTAMAPPTLPPLLPQPKSCPRRAQALNGCIGAIALQLAHGGCQAQCKFQTKLSMPPMLCWKYLAQHLVNDSWGSVCVHCPACRQNLHNVQSERASDRNLQLVDL